MMKDLSILNVAGAMARHASARHKVIAENVSNADTPGYKAQDLDGFDAMKAERLYQIVGDRGDRSLSLLRMMQSHDIENASASPNGNTVQVEDQMARSADAQAQHETALAIYRKSLDLLRLSFSSQR
ncbi:MAG: flagellar basal body protein [Rhodobacteraceae bacterium]|nr:flagellar basal body protein [Paracoccaceae bacterium]